MATPVPKTPGETTVTAVTPTPAVLTSLAAFGSLLRSQTSPWLCDPAAGAAPDLPTLKQWAALSGTVWLVAANADTLGYVIVRGDGVIKWLVLDYRQKQAAKLLLDALLERFTVVRGHVRSASVRADLIAAGCVADGEWLSYRRR